MNTKPLLFLLIWTSLLSCANFKSDTKVKNSAIRLVKTEKLVNYKLLSYELQFDTVLVVAKNNVKEKCIQENLVYISLQGFNKIDKLSDNGDEIFFVYKLKSGEHNNLKILTGSKVPGITKRQIFSYSSFPYFIENCTSLKK
jgi:hypothetical protein